MVAPLGGPKSGSRLDIHPVQNLGTFWTPDQRHKVGQEQITKRIKVPHIFKDRY